MPQTLNRHISLDGNFQQISYTAPKQLGQELKIPQRDRITHATKLNRQLQAIWSKINEDKAKRSAISLPTKSGSYIEFRSQAGKDLECVGELCLESRLNTLQHDLNVG